MKLPMPLSRRDFLVLGGAAAVALALPAIPGRALAQAGTAAGTALTPGAAQQFVQATAAKLIAVINGPGTPAEKQRAVAPIVDGTVDVDGVARFCLGHYWREATPQEQADYLRLFHTVLVNSITGRLGDYRGVQVAVGRAETRPDGVEVTSVVNRPNNPPAAVTWVIDTVSGQSRIVDLIAEGTSLRITQRSDYASYLVRNGNRISALLNALRQQAQS